MRRTATASATRDIDYRHLVAALRRKPGAFARWVLRDAVFPRAVYRQTWERLAAARPEREACRTMVGLLVLAADGHEAQLADELEQLVELDQLPDLNALTQLLSPPTNEVPGGRVAAIACWLRRADRRGVVSGAAVASGGRLGMMLSDLRLPTIKRLADDLCAHSDREGWPRQRLLEALLEHELAERETRRIDRHRVESALSPDKRLSSFDQHRRRLRRRLRDAEPVGRAVRGDRATTLTRWADQGRAVSSMRVSSLSLPGSRRSIFQVMLSSTRIETPSNSFSTWACTVKS